MSSTQGGAKLPEARVKVTGVRAATETSVKDGKKKTSHFLILDTTAGSLTGLMLTDWELVACIMNDVATSPNPADRAAKIREAIVARIGDVQTAKGLATERNTTVMAVSTL